ncbi:hypothetical protein HMPREF3190_01456 [Umbribacter vaginalis]|nr:hypothetical protein HMPREF3190_01456 [Coriobacteriales bacterium DNF00809]
MLKRLFAHDFRVNKPSSVNESAFTISVQGKTIESACTSAQLNWQKH